MTEPSSVIVAGPAPSDPGSLLSRALGGDEHALAALFDGQRERLRRMVRLRLDRRLWGRVDCDDVLQDAYLEARKRLPDYVRDFREMPFDLWLRLVTGQKLTDLHRFHLGAHARNAGMEISLHRGAYPQASSVSLAAQLLGKITSASRAAIRAEHRLIIQEALNGMEAIDREVLALRHFELLSNDQTALVLGLTRKAASNRYVRALRRLKEVLASIPGMNDDW
jgi:RNA polymerase sigma-70 factor (ECF subfamily)